MAWVGDAEDALRDELAAELERLAEPRSASFSELNYRAWTISSDSVRWKRTMSGSSSGRMGRIVSGTRARIPH